MPDFESILRLLITGDPLSESLAEAAFECLLTGAASDAQIGAFLGIIASRPGGAAVDELVGAARVMRRHATPVERPTHGRFAHACVLDTCGTGGAPKLFNVSTISAFIVAAASEGRIMVCKHGNISRTGRGSAELLRSLGVRIDAAPAVQQMCLRETGMCFSLAPAHHPAARHAAAARKSLGFMTIFNSLGPLANPAGATHQTIGTWSARNALLMAQALARLGTARALVYSSADGLDELTTTAPNHVFEVRGGAVTEGLLDAREFQLPRCSIADLQANGLDDAVRIARSVLRGEPTPHLDVTLLSAAVALWIGGVAKDVSDGLGRASAAVTSGRAAATLEALVRLSQG